MKLTVFHCTLLVVLALCETTLKNQRRIYPKRKKQTNIKVLFCVKILIQDTQQKMMSIMAFLPNEEKKENLQNTLITCSGLYWVGSACYCLTETYCMASAFTHAHKTARYTLHMRAIHGLDFRTNLSQRRTQRPRGSVTWLPCDSEPFSDWPRLSWAPTAANHACFCRERSTLKSRLASCEVMQREARYSGAHFHE